MSRHKHRSFRKGYKRKRDTRERIRSPSLVSLSQTMASTNEIFGDPTQEPSTGRRTVNG